MVWHKLLVKMDAAERQHALSVAHGQGDSLSKGGGWKESRAAANFLAALQRQSGRVEAAHSQHPLRGHPRIRQARDPRGRFAAGVVTLPRAGTGVGG